MLDILNRLSTRKKYSDELKKLVILSKRNSSLHSFQHVQHVPEHASSRVIAQAHKAADPVRNAFC